jgi:ATP-dependent helicase HrpB
MLQTDASLDGVSAILFDEFHERSLDADLGLALAREVQTTVRPDLRIVVMSATLAAQPVAALLGDAPIVISEGRLFPVETFHDPAAPGEPWDRAVARVVRRTLAEHAGDVLVFCPGVGEIARVSRLLHGVAAEVVALHGSMPIGEQARALLAGERRRVVLATSVAQTSVTVEGITVVIDGGLARVPRYDARRGMGHLATVRVSRATADQRRGRAGRLQPGTCYRVWSALEDARLVAADSPEIVEADLSALALDLARWGTPTGEGLAWLDPPPPAALTMARALLVELGACSADGLVNAHGRAIAELGIHPRLGHLVVRGTERGLGPLACRVAALLGERDPWPSARGPIAGDGRDRGAGRAQRPVDLSLRLQLLAGRAVDGVRGDKATIDRMRRDAARLASLVHAGSHDGPDDDLDLAVLVALAYPDRLAQLRTGSRTRYRLAGGGGAALGEHDSLAG